VSLDIGPIDGEVLLAIARGAVGERLGATALVVPEHAWLEQPAATFVTINRGEALRGCIGSIEPRRALGEDVRHNAQMAAFEDPRFPPMQADELELVRFSVSVLGPRSRIEFSSEEQARASLRPGIDGVILSWDGYRGVFLPQVWESLPERGAFLDNLKRKAGLPASFWNPKLVLERFEVMKFAEPRERAAHASQGWHH
jgi:AmmeMemoRadiSam system protein A